MLISEKTTGSIFFSSEGAYPIVKQLEKITITKAQAKVVKYAKNKSWVPRSPPLGHLSVNKYLYHKQAFEHYRMIWTTQG